MAIKKTVKKMQKAINRIKKVNNAVKKDVHKFIKHDGHIVYFNDVNNDRIIIALCSGKLKEDLFTVSNETPMVVRSKYTVIEMLDLLATPEYSMSIHDMSVVSKTEEIAALLNYYKILICEPRELI